MIRTKHEPTNLYCESGHGAYERETHIFLTETDNQPIRICKSAVELAAYLGGWVDSKKCSSYVSDVHDVEEYYKVEGMNHDRLYYKDYVGIVLVDIESDCFYGKILNINDIITYEGKTTKDIKTAFESAVDRYIAYRIESDSTEKG